MRKALAASVLLLAAGLAPAAVPGTELAAQRREAARITAKCGLPQTAILIGADGSIHMRPTPSTPYSRVECLLHAVQVSSFADRAPIGFVGNEKYDPKVH